MTRRLDRDIKVIGALKAGYEWRAFKDNNGDFCFVGIAPDKEPIKCIIKNSGLVYETIVPRF